MSRRHLIVSLAPTALAAVVLAAAGPVPESSEQATLWLLFSTVACLGLGSLHRPVGGSTLGAGVMALPAAVVLAGPVGAGWAAAAGYALGGLGRRLLWQLSPAAPDERRGPLRIAEGAGRSALAALAAGGAWLASATSGLTIQAAAGGTAYAATFFALVIASSRLRGRKSRLHPGHLFAPLVLDLAGWSVGCLLVAAVAGGAGWPVATALQWALALLVLEAARLNLLQGAFERRAVELARVSQASRRMAASGFGLAGLAVQLRAECLRVIEAPFFQLELDLEGKGADAAKSWWIGPDGVVHGGAPKVAPSPPPLPGIHRRTRWQVIERLLEIDGRRMARIRLWCDPRRIEPEDVDLLDRLAPQLGAWIHRALLDREAREDPLTGIPVRRLLERSLADAFTRCRETGGRMAVVMCDLDHFKRINDTFGHATGDRALKAVAGALEAHRRQGDTVARYGGEEFAVLLDRADGETALGVAERLRQAVEALVVEERGRGVPLSVSLGVAAFPELWAAAPGELLALADEALYEAKRHGRNRALLNLGRGRFRGVDGKVVGRSGEEGGDGGDEGGGEEGKTGGVEVPRFFA